MLNSRREVVSQSNQVGIEFLLVDLRTAFTFLDIAEITAVEETRARNLAHVRRVYATLLRFSPKIAPSPRQAAELTAGIAELRRRLEEAGYLLPSE
ncbi:MAG TPA: hypothetical protein VFB43_05660 [Terracidiphilus sp.]|jgi:hypothetical protein|nr:hypothetical protein [Terracidiphilus sp.]